MREALSNSFMRIFICISTDDCSRKPHFYQYLVAKLDFFPPQMERRVLDFSECGTPEKGDKSKSSAPEKGESSKASTQEKGDNRKSSAPEENDSRKSSTAEEGDSSKSSTPEKGDNSKSSPMSFSSPSSYLLKGCR